jgi:hypothetical protein
VPTFIVPIHEYNHCHDPQTGQFCSDTTRVGITSARGPNELGQRKLDQRSNATVFQQMRQFEAQLRALPGVSRVTVQPGLGAWGTGAEPTWIVGYRGNGAARRLLAQTGKAYNQDAVLLLKGCRGPACSPVAEIRFDTPLSQARRQALDGVLAGEGFGGWTWGKRNGRMFLRVAHVPPWSDKTPEEHVAAMQRVATGLSAQRVGHQLQVRKAQVEILDWSNYDAEGARDTQPLLQAER